MNIKNIENINMLVCGEKYSGEVLIVDYGMGSMGINEESWYVVLNDGEVVELK